MLLFFALPAALSAWGLAELFDWMDGSAKDDDADTVPEDTETAGVDAETDSDLTNAIFGTDEDDILQTDDSEAELYGGDGADVFWIDEENESDFDVETDVAYDDPDQDPYGTYAQIAEGADLTIIRDYDYDEGDRILIEVNWHPEVAGTEIPDVDLRGVTYSATAAQLPDGTTGAVIYGIAAYTAYDADGAEITDLGGSFDLTPVFIAGFGNPYEFETTELNFILRDTDAAVDDAAIEDAVRNAGLNGIGIRASDFIITG
ncbi:hypothetical protein BVC71_08470 [Marivivens niveibacter]|uniref:Uncharacterized protein n=1 Tax=Marivivens niveibacter TaxID=1930667 RepID=A0A251WZI5_9RHOB|nr:hypothetical protein [Marivivens niveibacter]OUD09847.1 hypothetical protein BVC71_08470 [Marivivens niveibacter]